MFETFLRMKFEVSNETWGRHFTVLLSQMSSLRVNFFNWNRACAKILFGMEEPYPIRKGKKRDH